MWSLMLGLSLVMGDVAEPLSSEEQQQVDALTNDLNSPFCPGRTLATCTSPKAGEWRDDIRGWVQEGVNGEQIRSRLQERVPDFRLSARPPGAWSTTAPAIVLSILTLAFLAVALRLRPGARAAPSPESPKQESEDSEAQVELRRQLADLD
ncbi:MAG: cytochrome c-type biogenesis protein CcmH [Myxococcota bacterium]